MRNKKAFTLIEVLLIITLIGMLAVAALTSFFDTSATFTFFSKYKPIILDIRKARSYAVNNKDSDTYERYGVEISENGLILFGDGKLGDPYEYDGEPGDKIIEELDLTPYEVIYNAPEGTNYKLPIYLYYDFGDGELTSKVTTATDDIVLLDKSEYRKIELEFRDDDLGLSKYFYIFQVSGIVEEITDPTAF
jgi:Prokaryotic N-terminal methylation motif